jgi:hypothetical protein|tara:strand:- start:384 stop:683 length:300 start_codon:yes stop_codon:yes gene_type:complete
MMNLKVVFEDGDYVQWRSTNHSDPDRQAEIVREELDGDVTYWGYVVDSDDGIVFEKAQYSSYETAVRNLECQVSMRMNTMPAGGSGTVKRYDYKNRRIL